MKIKVSSSFSGVLPVGSFANMRPSFSAEAEYDYNGENLMGEIEQMQNQLHLISYRKFQSVAEEARVQYVKDKFKSVRFHTIKDEEGNEIQVPSVSSISSFDKVFDIAEEELNQYASQGTLADIKCRHYMQTGVWENDLTKIPNTFTDLMVIRKGNLGLSPTDFDFPAFLAKFPIKDLTEGKFTFSLKHRFAGTPDAIGIFEGKRTLIDFKRTPDKSYFKQLAGYCIALEEQGLEPFEQLMLIGVNPDTKQGFSKPIVTSEVEQFKTVFLTARENFKKLFLV